MGHRYPGAHRRSRWPILDVATTFRPAIQLYGAARWTCAGSVTVEIPREQLLKEFVYLGPEPADLGAVRRGSVEMTMVR